MVFQNSFMNLKKIALGASRKWMAINIYYLDILGPNKSIDIDNCLALIVWPCYYGSFVNSVTLYLILFGKSVYVSESYIKILTSAWCCNLDRHSQWFGSRWAYKLIPHKEFMNRLGWKPLIQAIHDVTSCGMDAWFKQAKYKRVLHK